MSYKISDICYINCNNLSMQDTWKFINYLDTANLNEGVITKVQKLIVGKDKIPSRAKRKVNKNDILISTVRPNQKHYGILKDVEENMIVSTGFVVLSANDYLVDAEYLYRFLTQDKITAYLQAIAETSTSAYPSITPSIIGDLSIDLPSLNKQKAIANILSTLDEKIEVNNQINKTLENMAQTIFKRWFVDFEFPNKEGEPYKSSGGEMVESELGLIPKGWGIDKIGNISEIQNGFAFKASEYVEDGIKVLRTLNINDDGYFENKNLVYLPAEYKSDKYKKYFLKKFDTALVMVGASVGKIGLVLKNTEGSLQNQNMWRFRTNNKQVPQMYLYYIVKETQKISNNWRTGSAREFYRKDSFSKIKIIVPNDKILKSFDEMIIPIFNKISYNSVENENLTNIRNTLLPKLISGEIRVPLNN